MLEEASVETFGRLPILSPPNYSLPISDLHYISGATVTPTPETNSKLLFANKNIESPGMSNIEFSTPAGNRGVIDFIRTPVENSVNDKQNPPPPPIPERQKEKESTKQPERQQSFPKNHVQDRLAKGFNPILGLTPGGQIPKKLSPKKSNFSPLNDIEEIESSNAHHKNPFELEAEENSTVEASFPFQGDEKLLQLHFYIGDSILILKKEPMWSWGKVLRNGSEGWFPNNYVQATFQPLPGIHELMLKLGKNVKNERQFPEQEIPPPNLKYELDDIAEETSKTSEYKNSGTDISESNNVEDKMNGNKLANSIPELPPFQPEIMNQKVPETVMANPAVKEGPNTPMLAVEGRTDTDTQTKPSDDREIEGIGQLNVVADTKCKCSLM